MTTPPPPTVLPPENRCPTVLPAHPTYDDLIHALQVIMPMAKGYAHAHQVGENGGMVRWAEEMIERASCAPNAQAEIDRLRAVCQEAYQAIGALASEAGCVAHDQVIKAMDNLDAAGCGDPLPHETFLPMPFGNPAALRDERGGKEG